MVTEEVEEQMEDKEVPDTSPPVFSTWNRAYGFIAAFLLFEIIIFYLITILLS